MSSDIICMDDLPFTLDAQETEALMKKLPEHLAATGREWGFNDTVFQNELFVYVVKEILHFKSVDEYYASEIFKNYTEKEECLSNSILLGNTKRFKIMFNATFYDKSLNEAPPHHGDFESIATDCNTAKKNAFFELAKLVFKSGYVVKKLEIIEIKEI